MSKAIVYHGLRHSSRTNFNREALLLGDKRAPVYRDSKAVRYGYGLSLRGQSKFQFRKRCERYCEFQKPFITLVQIPPLTRDNLTNIRNEIETRNIHLATRKIQHCG